MGNCVSATTGVEHRGETKPASLIGSVDHLGSVCTFAEHAAHELHLLREMKIILPFLHMAISRFQCRITPTLS